MKKKSSAKRSEILFLNVRPGTRDWLQTVTKRLMKKNELWRITRSETADRILRNLKNNPRLLREALK